MSYDDKKSFDMMMKRKGLFGKFLLATRCVRWYRDGTFFSPSFLWWHPVTWVLLTAFIVLSVPMALFTEASLKGLYSELRALLAVDSHFKENPERLRWYNPYTEESHWEIPREED